jgi:DNA-binding transcriptional ArsR family regulator
MITVYLDTKDSILLRSKDITFHVLYYILQQSNEETNTWYADKEHKQIIMDKLGLAQITLEKHLASLKERKLLISEMRGRYKLNTKIFTI